MFNFSTTTIINSNLDSSGLAKYVGSATDFNVKRVNKFLKTGIASVYKRPYAAGVLEVAKVTIPVVTAGKVIRLTIDVRLSQQTDSEYANTYLYFKKPVVVEVLATGTAATDATALVNAIKGLKDRYGFAYVTAALVNTADVQITALNNNQRFWAMTVESDKASTNSLIQPEYDDITAGTFSVTTKGSVGFGDDEYMIKSISFPTYENSRFFGTNKEERPIPGGNYTQYTIRYDIPKNVDYNIGISGMGDRSITNHVFYVLSTLVAGFETELAKAFTGLVTIGGDQDLIIIGDQDVAASAGATQYLVVNASGTVNWTNSTLTGTTSANTTGILTVGSTKGTTTLTATDAAGKTATMVITVY